MHRVPCWSGGSLGGRFAGFASSGSFIFAHLEMTLFFTDSLAHNPFVDLFSLMSSKFVEAAVVLSLTAYQVFMHYGYSN